MEQLLHIETKQETMCYQMVQIVAPMVQHRMITNLLSTLRFVYPYGLLRISMTGHLSGVVQKLAY